MPAQHVNTDGPLCIQFPSESPTTPANCLRHLVLTRSVVISPAVSSSILLELGHTKLIATVTGPHRRTPNSAESSYGQVEYSDEGGLIVTVKYAPFARRSPKSERDLYNPSTKMAVDEAVIAQTVKTTLQQSLLLVPLGKCVLDIHVLILQEDGATKPASVIASSLACADAGVGMIDLVSSCTVHVSSDGKTITLDPTFDEGMAPGTLVTVSMLPSRGDILDYQVKSAEQVGVGVKDLERAKEVAVRGAKAFGGLMRASLINNGGRERYSSIDAAADMEVS